jgi:hypothetical protein
MAAHLYRYMQFGGGDFSRLKAVVSGHGLNIDGLDEVIAFGETEKRASSKSEYGRIDDLNWASSKTVRNWDDVFAGCDLTNADGLARAHSALKRTESPWNHDQFFEEAIGRVPVGSEAAFIEAVGNTPEFNLYQFRNFLEQAPDAWKGRPATMHAIAGTLKAYCRRYCMEISKNRRYEALPFKTACALAGISESDIVEIVLDAVGETPDLADSNRLFSLVGLLASSCPKMKLLRC